MRRPRFPRYHRLPFGYRVEIKRVTSAELVALGLGDCHGAWVSDDKTVFINADDHVAEQAESLAHELQHVATDYRHWVDQYIRLPLQTESAETAIELAEDDE